MKTITVILATFTITKNRDAYPITREIPVYQGTSIREFFNLQFSGCAVGNYFIRVNNLPVKHNYKLRHKDKVHITPNNLKRVSTVATSPSSYYTTQTTAVSGTVGFDNYEWDNNVDPALLELEEKVKKLME